MASEKFDEKEGISGFKLLSIRPLQGCSSRFRKNLKEGMVYKFYQNYDYYINIDTPLLVLQNHNLLKRDYLQKAQSSELHCP